MSNSLLYKSCNFEEEILTGVEKSNYLSGRLFCFTHRVQFKGRTDTSNCLSYSSLFVYVQYNSCLHQPPLTCVPFIFTSHNEFLALHLSRFRKSLQGCSVQLIVSDSSKVELYLVQHTLSDFAETVSLGIRPHSRSCWCLQICR